MTDWLDYPARAGVSTVIPISDIPAVDTSSWVTTDPGSPGYTPDYSALAKLDPAYLLWKNNSLLNMAQAESTRRAFLRALAVQHGGMPSGFSDRYGDIDQATLGLAGKNQQSDIARIARSYDQNVAQGKASLSARGGLQSGELQYMLDQADLQRQSNEYDSGQQFANAFNQAINAYVGAQLSDRQGEYDALVAAYRHVMSDPRFTPIPPTQPQGKWVSSGGPEWYANPSQGYAQYGAPQHLAGDRWAL
jgi:hypothetical protein